MLDAINEANKKKLLEKILELILKDNELLESIKESKKLKKLNGDGWEAGDDDCEVLKGHLEAESIDKLKEFEAALTGKPAPKTKATFKLDGMFAGIGQLVEIFTGLFTGAGGGFLGHLMQMFHQFNVSIDPTVALIKQEMDAAVHGKLFFNLGKTNKEINGVYRDLIGKTSNDEQVFNGLLRHVKTLHPKQSRDAHKILKAAEYQLLGGRFSEEGVRLKILQSIIGYPTFRQSREIMEDVSSTSIASLRDLRVAPFVESVARNMSFSTFSSCSLPPAAGAKTP